MGTHTIARFPGGPLHASHAGSLASSVALLALASCSAVPRVSNPEVAHAIAPTPGASLETSAPAVQETQPPPQKAAPKRKDTSINALDLLVGKRSLDEDFWTPVDEQVAFGLQYAGQTSGSVIGFETGLFYSQEDDVETVDVPPVGPVEVELDASLVEFYVGLHKSFGTTESLLRPYLGAGLTTILVSAEGEVEGMGSVEDDDATLGFYLHGGLPFQVTESFRIGLDARLVTGTDV